MSVACIKLVTREDGSTRAEAWGGPLGRCIAAAERPSLEDALLALRGIVVRTDPDHVRIIDGMLRPC